MSVRELEKQIRALPPRQLRHFDQWFDDYRQQAGPASETEDDLTEAQQTELLRRIELAKAHPELLQPWKGRMANLRGATRRTTPAPRSPKASPPQLTGLQRCLR
jgi:hypothetical protein